MMEIRLVMMDAHLHASSKVFKFSTVILSLAKEQYAKGRGLVLVVLVYLK